MRQSIFTKSSIRGFFYFLPSILIVIMLFLWGEPPGTILKWRMKDVETEELIPVTAGDGEEDEVRMFCFDPNTAEFEDLRALGFTRSAAAALIRSRVRGKVFSIKEDVATVYGVDDSLYQRLKPYITISPEYAPLPYDADRYDEQRKSRPIVYEPFRIDTVTTAYLRTIGFTHRRALAFLNYRDMRGGLRSIEEVGECFVIDKAECDTLAKYIIFPDPEKADEEGPALIEVNTADSATLRSVRGIGEFSIARILDCRQRLGGFVSLNQLAELKLVTENNFEAISRQIYCDSCNISKIDINFASPNRFAGHPYITDKALRKLLNKRELKGGWSNIEEMVKDKIFTRDEAERLRPYLRFTNSTEQ